MGNFRYRMIAEKILSDIKSDKLQPGMTVPSSRELSRIFHVSQVTAVHALTYLAKKGILQHKPGKNYHVAKKTDNLQKNHRFLTMLFRHISTEGKEFYGNRIISGVMHEAAIASVGTYFSASTAQLIYTRQTDFSRTKEEALMLPEQNLGFIADFHIPDNVLEEIVYETKLPLAVIGRESNLPGVFSVVLDPMPGYRFALQTLKRLGYTSFICCEGHETRRCECLKQRMFYRELSENEECAILSAYTALPWTEQRKKLHEAVNRFAGKKTAVFFPNDSSARTGIACFTDWKLKIPEQIGVIGFYGTRIATELTPKLCCLAVQPEQLGKTAVNLLLSQESEVPVHEIPMQFIFGETI